MHKLGETVLTWELPVLNRNTLPGWQPPVVLMCPRLKGVLWEILALQQWRLEFESWANLILFIFQRVSLRSDGHKLMKLHSMFSLLEMMLVFKSLTLSVIYLITFK